MAFDQIATMRKVSFRLVPMLCLIYFVSYLDRVNIGFAALQMNVDIGISSAVYGAGASMFFVGYLLFEVPSNLMLEKFGAKIWLARIMITWGLVSSSMAFVVGEKSLYLVRFLLGVAEAGLFPAVIIYISHWFPRSYRARITGLYFIGVPLSSILGAPVSTALLDHTHGLGGLGGWQWMFLLEGLPAVLLGIFCLWYLVDRPDQARWLAKEEAAGLQTILDEERAGSEAVRKYRFVEVFTDVRVLVLAFLLLLLASGSYGEGFWLPQIIKVFTTSNMVVGWIASAIYVFAVIVMILVTRYSDSRGKRVGPVAISAAVSGIGFLICMTCFDSPYLAIAGLTLACTGTLCALPVFWSIPTSFLTGTAAAGAVALINSVAGFSGLLVPWLVGLSKDATGGFQAAIGGLGALSLLASVVVLFFGTLGKSGRKPPLIKDVNVALRERTVQ